MTELDSKTAADRSEEIASAMSKLLSGEDVRIGLGAAADLAARVFAQFDQATVDELLPMWIEQVRELIPVNRNMLAENLCAPV